jgi:hypothetical protein
MYSLAPSVYLSTDLPPFHVYKSCCDWLSDAAGVPVHLYFIKELCDWLSGAAGRACSPLHDKRAAVIG